MLSIGNSERQEIPTPEELFEAKIVHINMATGGAFYTSVPDDYDGPCNVTDISFPDRPVSLAVLPNYKEAKLLAFVAITPDGGYSEVLVETSDNPVTHQSFIDWL